jgi:exo-beta-1,3-glucanase (GH17 family)
MMSKIAACIFFVCIVNANIQAAVPQYLERAFKESRWIAYSPTGSEPTPSSTDAITADLKVLKKDGFQGIVTYGCDGLKKEIPRIAREEGIDFVVLGIWDPTSDEEISNARDVARFVDAYCVGNEGVGGEKRYTLAELGRTIEALQQWSGKPVTTSEQIEDYFTIPELRELGDWLFPNVHPYWHKKVAEPDASHWTNDQFQKLCAAAPTKIVLCKEVGLPTGSLDIETKLPDEKSQLDYYAALKKTETRFVYFEAFDQVWKKNHPVEPFWGLYRSDRTPKLIMGIEPPPESMFVKIQDTDALDVQKTPASGGLFKIRGSSAGITEGKRKLLMFINPNDVAAPGWFLQLPPRGVSDIREDGSWTAVGQIGNREYPPQKDQQMSIMMLAVPVIEADQLVQARLNEPTLQNTGILTQDLPQVEQQWRARVDDLPIRFVPRLP